MARHERLTVNKLYVNDIINQVYGGNIEFGVNDTGVDVKLYGATSGSFALWDESLDKMVFDAADLQLGDSDELRFGDAAAGDWVWKFDGADFTMLPASAVEALNIGSTTKNVNITHKGTFTVGVDDTGYDVKLFGATAGASFLWDESDDSIIMSAAQLEFDSYKTDGAFDFANATNGWRTGSVAAATTPIGAVKVLVGGTTGYIVIHSVFAAA